MCGGGGERLGVGWERKGGGEGVVPKMKLSNSFYIFQCKGYTL